MNWYVVNSKPRQEHLAAQSLQRLGVESFLPQIRRSRLVRGVRKVNTCPLFPGYLFSRFDLAVHFRAVNFSTGVRKVVSFGSSPVIVEEALIQSIRDRMTDGFILLQPASLIPGQSVRIEEGPFQGLEAVFERPLNDQGRIMLLLQALSYQARVVVDLDCVANL
jgi:transcriptional antiterminator RfaH